MGWRDNRLPSIPPHLTRLLQGSGYPSQQHVRQANVRGFSIYGVVDAVKQPCMAGDGSIEKEQDFVHNSNYCKCQAALK